MRSGSDSDISLKSLEDHRSTYYSGLEQVSPQYFLSGPRIIPNSPPQTLSAPHDVEMLRMAVSVLSILGTAAELDLWRAFQSCIYAASPSTAGEEEGLLQWWILPTPRLRGKPETGQDASMCRERFSFRDALHDLRYAVNDINPKLCCALSSARSLCFAVLFVLIANSTTESLLE